MVSHIYLIKRSDAMLISTQLYLKWIDKRCIILISMGNHPPPKTDKPILVTGATGYIGSQIIEILLKEGYHVRGTVRSLQNQQETAFLSKLKHSEHLSIVEADLTNDACWDATVNGCEYVIHTASPVLPYVAKNEDELIKPAVEGAKSVFNAAIKHNVKRVVLTSSIVTLFAGNEGQLLDEGYWADLTKSDQYGKSKVLAEQAVWEIYRAQKLQTIHTELVTILPSFVLGPGHCVHGNTSEVVIAEVLRGTFPGIPSPQITYNVVDVNDVAMSHCLSLFKANIDGHRIIVSAGQMNFTQIVQILQKNFPDHSIKTHHTTAEDIKNSGNQIAIRQAPMMGKTYPLNNVKSVELLGIKYKPVDESIVEMGKQLKSLKIVT